MQFTQAGTDVARRVFVDDRVRHRFPVGTIEVITYHHEANWIAQHVARSEDRADHLQG
jgi:hypothetical protein